MIQDAEEGYKEKRKQYQYSTVFKVQISFALKFPHPPASFDQSLWQEATDRLL